MLLLALVVNAIDGIPNPAFSLTGLKHATFDDIRFVSLEPLNEIVQSITRYQTFHK